MPNRSDDVELPDRGYNTEDIRTIPPQPRKRRRWGLWILAVLLFGPALVFTLWAAITLNFTYSRGERGPGVIQKFSQKGWLCKTWEGELAMVPSTFNMPSEVFRFTVRDDSIAQVMNRFMRQGARITVHYAQHRGVPTTCFGETQYYVTGAEALSAPAATPGSTAPGAAPVPGAAPGTTPGAAPGAGVPPRTPVTTPPPAANTPAPTTTTPTPPPTPAPATPTPP